MTDRGPSGKRQGAETGPRLRGDRPELPSARLDDDGPAGAYDELPDYAFALDPFQVAAIESLDAGRSVLVAAPTGSGKTVVAEHAVALALAAGRRVFYTTPIKALSNQKFADLARRYGPSRVGLLTGDNAINGDAPVVVMTTEVLRNMIYAGSAGLDELSWVVLDEVHYLQDAYRGPVWEEVIIHAPPRVRLVCLSATVSNAQELADWISLVRGRCDVVVETERPVQLDHLFMAAERSTDRLHVLPTLVDGRPNPDGRRFDAAAPRVRGRPGRPRLRFSTPRRVDVVDELADRDLVPALYFIFSRAGCDEAVSSCLGAGLRLTPPDERDRIRVIAEDHTRNLSDADLDVLRYPTWLGGLEAGIAAHHAGMVPPFKEAVEACFVEGLVKVVFATETLALGVNMPARTVVIEKLTKFNGERHEFLNPGEYTQLTGRAGRRGIDPMGHAVVLWNPFVTFDDVAALAASRSFALRSAFRPTYNMSANLVRRYGEEDATRLLNRSFAQYQADRSVVQLEQRLRERRAEVERLREALPVPAEQIAELRSLRRRAEDAGTPDQIERRAIESAVARLAPGSVIRLDREQAEPGVVVSVGQRRGGGVRVKALTASRRMVLVRPEDFQELPARLGEIELPRPYAPYERHFQDEVVRRLARARLAGGDGRRDGGGRGGRGGRHGRAAEHGGTSQGPANRGRDNRGPHGQRGSVPAVSEPLPAGRRRAAALWRQVERHPLTGHPQLDQLLRAAARIERFERDIADLSRRVDRVADTVARRFTRLLGLLEAWGYVDGWRLTARGQLLARCYHECDLLVVEALARGYLDDLDAPAFAALVSVFSYEHRSRTAPQQSWMPSPLARDRYQGIQELWRELNNEEESAHLPLTREPDATFAGLAYAWASGGDLDDVLLDEEVSGGDFVRNVKQLVDLCRQLGDLAPVPGTARAARRAAELLYRGVVAASSVVEVDDDLPDLDEEPEPPEGAGHHRPRDGRTHADAAADGDADADGDLDADTDADGGFGVRQAEPAPRLDDEFGTSSLVDGRDPA
jgi:ATP-dependent RNA helicase HelY